jgi:hypothetical protein
LTVIMTATPSKLTSSVKVRDATLTYPLSMLDE